MTEFKRITMKVNDKQHRFLRNTSRPNDITQEELISLMIDVLAANPKVLEPHILRFKKQKEVREARQREMEAKAKSLISTLTDEQQEQLLSGKLDLSKLL